MMRRSAGTGHKRVKSVKGPTYGSWGIPSKKECDRIEKEGDKLVGAFLLHERLQEGEVSLKT
jgi:hypothetical protein